MKEGCESCIIENRVFSVVSGRDRLNSRVLFKRKCFKCLEVKPWHEFSLDPHKDSFICFACRKTSSDEMLNGDTIRIEIERTINKLIQCTMNKNLDDLRDHLFKTIENLNAGTIDVAKAKSICDVAQAIINTGKLEVDFIRAVGGVKKSDFIQVENRPKSEKQVIKEDRKRVEKLNGKPIMDEFIRDEEEEKPYEFAKGIDEVINNQ